MEDRNIVFANVEYFVCIHIKIVMDYNVTHSHDAFPWYFGIRRQ